MTTPKIIIFTGRKQAGKDTSAVATYKVLTQQFRKTVKIIAFADYLKEIAINVFGLTQQQVYGTDNDKNTLTPIKWGDLPLKREHWCQIAQAHSTNTRPIYEHTLMTAREFLKVFGTDICRTIYTDCWALATFNRAKAASEDFVLISDCRFPNEIDVFLSLNPVVFRLMRSISNNDAHPSETALDTYNWNKLKHFYSVDNRKLSLSDKNTIIQEKVYEHFAPILCLKS